MVLITDSFQEDGELYGYYVMQHFPSSLEEYLKDQKVISHFDILESIIQAIRALELLHESGRTHNDIKMDNLMIMPKKDCNQFILIDYGHASSYRNKKGEHLEQAVAVNFNGNILFASKDSFNFLTVSRRNDL